jgi:hypothetical protein
MANEYDRGPSDEELNRFGAAIRKRNERDERRYTPEQLRLVRQKRALDEQQEDRNRENIADFHRSVERRKKHDFYSEYYINLMQEIQRLEELAKPRETMIKGPDGQKFYHVNEYYVDELNSKRRELERGKRLEKKRLSEGPMSFIRLPPIPRTN